VLIGGWGDRLLGVAARHADIIAFTGAAASRNGGPLQMAGLAETEERVAYVRELLGPRLDKVEFNILVQRVVPPAERASVLEVFGPALPPDVADSPEDHPILLMGTPEEMADRLRDRRERYGISYITVLEDSMEKFAPVIQLLR
jgi:alkanesulfonate monooxygenase SsuD/methylene tetrahydromethanopterin reductase-like flavin-dependent oxidoreductase (luciferase family)